jgi:hypothetical protein
MLSDTATIVATEVTAPSMDSFLRDVADSWSISIDAEI